jgi:hypothetical protein
MKENKARSLARKAQQPKIKPKKSRTIDSRKVHDAKGRNYHGRHFR